MERQYCKHYGTSEIKLLKHMRNGCRYHKIIGQEYNLKSITPANLCPDAFHSAYPYCLALLYDAEIKHVRIKCPNDSNYITMKISKHTFLPEFAEKLKNKFLKTATRLGFSGDIIIAKVKIKIENIKGVCPAEYTVGDEFEFNIRKQTELCPASFASVFPFIGNNRATYWREKNSSVCIQCPDRTGAVYEIKNGK